MPTHATCRREIEALHAFFVDWYTGRLTEDAGTRVGRALDPDFEMVTPDGERRAYADVVDGIRERYASHDPGSFEIDVRNVETRRTLEDHRLVRYEGWQTTAGETTGRLSTVFFEGDADTQAKWSGSISTKPGSMTGRAVRYKPRVTRSERL
jgi:hypothetical protein